MIRVRVWTRDELLAQRQALLARHGLTLDEFRRRASSYTLRGREYDAWDELRDIAFLLGEEREGEHDPR